MALKDQGAARGFTLVELLLVLFIMMLLVGVAAPTMSKLMKTSRVDEGAKAVFTALWQTRSQAMRLRKPAALMYGADADNFNPAPQAGVLPPKGQMEIWTVRYINYPWYMLSYYTKPYYPPNPTNYDGVPGWYPFHLTMDPLTPQAISLPEGVRVMACMFDRNVSSRKLEFKYYQKSALGEIKRHATAYNQMGGLCATYPHVIIYDQASGDHQLIQCAYQGVYGISGNTRPVFIKEKINYVGPTQLKSFLNLDTLVREYPGDS